MDTAIIILKGIPLLVLVFLCWPLLMGTALGLKKNIDRYIIGFAVVQAVFFLCYIPAILNEWSSRTLTAVGAITISVLAIAGSVIRFAKASDKKEFLSIIKPNLQYLKNPFFIGALIIIGYEMWTYVTKEPYIYGDDVSYIKTITRFVDTNAIYVKEWVGQDVPNSLDSTSFKILFTSYYPFIGMISILTGLHPLILCKTIIPLIYVPLHYLIIFRMGLVLFNKCETKERINRLGLFMFFYSVLIEFGQISYFTISRRVTIWIYNNKSDCFCLLLIALFVYLYILLVDQSEDILNSKTQLYRQIVVFCIALACNSSSLMGVIFSAMIMGIWFVIESVRKKNPLFFLSCLWMFIPHVVVILVLIKHLGFAFI